MTEPQPSKSVTKQGLIQVAAEDLNQALSSIADCIRECDHAGLVTIANTLDHCAKGIDMILTDEVEKERLAAKNTEAKTPKPAPEPTKGKKTKGKD